jgi:hypothetical protein
MAQKKEGEIQEFFSAAEDVVRYFTKSKTFVEEVMRENERLRYRVLHMQQELARAQQKPAGGGDPASENLALKKQLEEIKSQFDALNRENEDFRQRFQEVERQNENLLNLYVSGYQLHSTLDEQAVLQIIKEILLNLLGAEVFAIWLLRPDTGRMELVTLVDECGHLQGAKPRLGKGIWEVIRDGQNWFGASGGGGSAVEPLSCIPLKVEERPVGALAIFKLLVQKGGFSSLDQELLGLMASQAATAVIGAQTFTRTGVTLQWAADDDGADVSAGC